MAKFSVYLEASALWTSDFLYGPADPSQVPECWILVLSRA